VGLCACVRACDWVEGVEQEVVQLQRDLWLAEYHRRQAQRDLERVQSCGGNKDQATWEYKNVRSWICSRTTSLTLTLFITISMVVRSPQDSGIRELTLRAMGGSCAAGFVQELQA
jgi:hypothetical protein